jgi:hypothetical protein
MFRRAKHWLWLLLCWFMLAGHGSGPCPATSTTTATSIATTSTSSSKPSSPGLAVSGPNDPRDPDSNGRIDSIDGRLCALRCTRARCGTINQPPFANAGPDQSVRVGGPVRAQRRRLVRPRRRPAALPVDLQQPSPRQPRQPHRRRITVAPRFTADKPGQYLIQLIVSDGKADSAADTVTVSTENSRPIANAGPDQSVRVGTLVSAQRRRLDRRRWRPPHAIHGSSAAYRPAAARRSSNPDTASARRCSSTAPAAT